MTFHHEDGRPIVRAGWRIEAVVRAVVVAMLIAFVAVNAHHVIRLFA